MIEYKHPKRERTLIYSIGGLFILVALTFAFYAPNGIAFKIGVASGIALQTGMILFIFARQKKGD